MRDEQTLDPALISERPQVLRGTLAPGELEVLDDALADGAGELRYELTAVLDPQRRKVLSCIIEGFVFLMCQKSLEAFRHEISIRERLVLVDDEARLPPIEEESEVEDHMVASGPLDVRELVAEAVLLSLPMVPRKPGLEERPAGEGRSGRGDSPFAVLANLRKK